MIVNAKSIVQRATQIKNGIMVNVNVSVKSIAYAKKDYNWNPSICICENERYSKSNADTSVLVCDEIIKSQIVHQ